MNEPISPPCPEWEEKLTHIDPEDLSAPEREELTLHLESCPACAAVYEEYQRMDALIEQALTSDIALELPADFAASKPLHAHPASHTVIAQCRLKHLVEQDHVAHTYLGEHMHSNRQVVVKLHHGSFSDQEQHNFQKEAEAIANLKHPNILSVLEFGIHEEKPFIVMDHAPHGSLRQKHPRGLQVPLPTIVSYIKMIAEALQYAHERNILHRNLRPEKIFLGPDNQILLADFGIPALQANVNAVTHPGSEAHFYMAPEQFQGKHHAASDQYALAVMAYEWLSGERPFYGSVDEIASKHHESPPPLHEKVPALALAVEEVIFKALAKKPELRFESVLEFALALEEASTH